MNDNTSSPPVFHYTSVEAALKIILSNKIKFTAPWLSNDPFEYQYIPPAGDVYGHNFIEFSLKNTGVFCCSRLCNNILMWGHYATKHEGVVLGLEVNKDVFLSNRNNTDPNNTAFLNIVNYPKDREIYRPSIEEVKDLTVHTNRFMSQKSLDWEYEKEIRFYRTFVNKPDVVKKGYELVFFKDYGLMLTSIYFGLKSSESNQEMILSALKSNKDYADVKLFKMEKSPGKYSLDSKELEQGGHE